MSWSTTVYTACAALVVGACSSSAIPATQLMITVDADPQVVSGLERVRVLVYKPDATEVSKPAHQQLFNLAHDRPEPGEVKLPFSFGVDSAGAESVVVVVRGYTSFAANARPAVEQKIAASFEPRKTVPRKVTLTDTCWNRGNQCTALDVTCATESRGDVQAGACISIHAAESDAGEMLDSGAADSGASEAPEITDAPAARCDFDNDCPKEYPCVPSTTLGYSCQGQLADWPMPDAEPGAKFAPDYDTESAPGSVVDRVTGLIWQRNLEQSYAGCSGNLNGRADACTWSEALAYCGQLSLGGHRWRLPSKIELESLIDSTSDKIGMPFIDSVAFPDTPLSGFFWTASPVAFDNTFAWAVGGIQVTTLDTARFLPVRCVRSVLTAAGTPDGRYKADKERDSVMDTRTRLEWKTSFYEPEKTWDQAREQCASVEDYRLPTLKELLTLVDPTQSAVAWSAALAIPAGLQDYVWSATETITGAKAAVGSVGGFASDDRSIRQVEEIRRTTNGPQIHITFHTLCVR